MRNLVSFLLLMFLLGCSNNTPIQNNLIPVPAVGQWVAFGGNEPFITQGTQPSWPIPCCNGTIVAGYFYTNLGVVPTTAQSLVLTFTLTENSPVYVQAPAGGGNSQTDINPPTIHLFLWRKGDNLFCNNNVNGQGGFADYRLFAARTPLVAGRQTISVPLDTAHWTGCYGKPPLNMQDILTNLLGVGVTFGGQWFAGHGIYLSNGNAQFTINSFTVQ